MSFANIIYQHFIVDIKKQTEEDYISLKVVQKGLNAFKFRIKSREKNVFGRESTFYWVDDISEFFTK